MNNRTKGVIRIAASFVAIAVGVLLVKEFQNKDRTLSFDGLGPVRVGMTVPEAETALGATLTAPRPDDGRGEDCWYTQRADLVDETITYMIAYGKIVRINVDNAAPRKNEKAAPRVVSERGIHIGSSVADVMSAYGSALIVSPNPNGNDTDRFMLVLSEDGRHGLLFDIWDEKVDSFRNGTADAVQMPEGCS